jgi:hypothetical protein
MKKLATNEVTNLIEKDGIFILYNSSHTVIAKDKSLNEVYKKYKILESQIEKEFSDSDLDFNINNQSSINEPTGKIKIERSNRPLMYFLIFFIAVIFYFSFFLDFSRLSNKLSNEIKNVASSTIKSLPATVKNTMLYTANGESWCYGCALEEVIDAINEGSSRMTPQDLDRLKGKIEILKKTYGFDSN